MIDSGSSINPNVTIPDAPKAARRFSNGDEILGRYVVQAELGQGGMGVVYKCFDKIGGVAVAVKGLPPEVSHNSDEMEAVRENFQLVSELHHPNIAGVRTLEKDSATGDYYLVMTLARGVSLRHWLRQHGGKEHRAEQLNVLRQIASALDYAHNAEPKHIIHRDVKPENIMVDDGGHVMVLDFGLAAQVRSSLSRVSQVVTSRSGTPAYKSPEQWLAQAQRAPSDQYSLGVIAYQMFAGELPFDSDDLEILKHAVVFDPVPDIPDESNSISAVFAKALAKKPKDRFEGCAAFVAALSSDGARTPAAPLRWITVSAVLLSFAVAGGWWWKGKVKSEELSVKNEALAAERVSDAPVVPDDSAVPPVSAAAPARQPVASPATADRKGSKTVGVTLKKSEGVQLWKNGPYWAECNVGAAKPEETGYYFWWGDTVGCRRNANNDGWISVRDSASFKFVNENCPTFGKSNHELWVMGYIDVTTGNLVAAHDAATTHLGSPWRMPTVAELQALYENCTTRWETRNGVPGRLVTGKGAYASKSIFLPATDSGRNSYLYGYWSSTPVSGDSANAWYLDFNSDCFRWTYHHRYLVNSVRPVRGSTK